MSPWEGGVPVRPHSLNAAQHHVRLCSRPPAEAEDTPSRIMPLWLKPAKSGSPAGSVGDHAEASTAGLPCASAGLT